MKYVANQILVEALTITRVGDLNADGSRGLLLADGDPENGQISQGVATAGMVARYEPQVGDYWVVQEDGYVYLNPKDVFERKYSPHVNLGAEVRRLGLQGE